MTSRAMCCFVLLALSACAHRAALPAPALPLVATPEEAFRASPPPLGEPAAPEVPELHVRTLENGLLAIAIARPELPFVSIRYASSAAHERVAPERAGLTSLTARAMVRATESARDPFGARGLASSLHVGWDGTVLSVEARRELAEDAITLLADVLRRPALDRETLDEVRAALLREIRQAQRGGSSTARLHALAMLHGEGSRLAMPLAGSAGVIEGADQAAVRARWTEAFVPDASCVVVVGDLEPARALDTIEGALGAWPRGGARSREAEPVVSPRGDERVRVVGLPRAGAAIVALDPAPPWGHEDAAAFEIVTMALGGMFHAPLNMELREARGDTYGVQAFYDASRGHAELAIETLVPVERAREAIVAIASELERVRREPLAPPLLEAARAQVRERAYAALESRRALADVVAVSFVRGTALDAVLARAARVDALSAEDVRAVAERWLDPAHLAIALSAEISGELRAQLEGAGLGAVRWVETEE